MKAASLAMNPLLPEEDIAAAYELDPLAAEYGGEFRSDLEAFISDDLLARVVALGRLELPPVPGASYVGFVDPAGGSQHSFMLAVAHTATRGATCPCST